MLHISEEQVKNVLNWNISFTAVEQALLAVSTGRSYSAPRSITEVGNTGVLITMPGFLDDPKYGALGCKVFTVYPSNPLASPPLPKEYSNFMLLDSESGALKAVISAAQITQSRTVAASAIATRYLHGSNNNVLAIVGCGTLGKLHAEAFQSIFNFKEVRLWNRTMERAQRVHAEFKHRGDIPGIFTVCDSVEMCVKNADVVVAATTAEEVLVRSAWLKKGVHINATGINPFVQELDDETYKNSVIYVDHMEYAKQQLSRLLKIGAEFKSEIGDLISGKPVKPTPGTNTVFQSLGLAVEDCALARLVYDEVSKSCKNDCKHLHL